jgi:Recombinase
VQLGGDRGARLTAKARAAGRAAVQERARAPTIQELQATGCESLRAIAAGLEERGIPAARGGKWSAVQVSRLLEAAAVPFDASEAPSHETLVGREIGSGDFLTPSPPAEKATTSEDHAGHARAGGLGAGTRSPDFALARFSEKHYRSQWRGADATSIHSSRLSSPVMAAFRICAASWPSTFPFTVALRRLVPYA